VQNRPAQDSTEESTMTHYLRSFAYLAVATVVGGAAAYFCFTDNDAPIQTENTSASWVTAAFPTAQAGFAAHRVSRS
jgi:hypothetical protein